MIDEKKKPLTQEQLERLPFVVQREADDDTKREFCDVLLQSTTEPLFTCAQAIDNVKKRYSADPTKAETYSLALIQQIHQSNGGDTESWYAGYLVLGQVLNTSSAAAAIKTAFKEAAGDQKKLSSTRFRALAVEAQIAAWRVTRENVSAQDS